MSTPQRPQPNGVAEQAVRRVWEGTGSLLLQSGLPHPCWSDAANAICALRNIVDKVDGDKTPYFLRNGARFGGQLISFGASVEYKPASFKEKSAIQKCSPRIVRGILAGYHYHSGGEWSGDPLVYDERTLRAATT